MDLEQLLEEERERWIRANQAFSALVSLIKPRFSGLEKDLTLSDKAIEEHIAACREYYEKHGTKFGKSSPWIESRRA